METGMLTRAVLKGVFEPILKERVNYVNAALTAESRGVDVIESLSLIHILAGPTTLAALLNSLQMGFKTLAIEKRTGEVWRTIAAVKQDFVTFSLLLDKTKKKLQEASGHIDAAARRSRVINKRLDGRKDEEDTLAVSYTHLDVYKRQDVKHNWVVL